MRTFILVLSSALALGACGGSNETVSGLKKHKDKICACSDKACAEAAEKEFREWRKEAKDSMKKDGKPSESVLKELNEVEKELKECLNKHRDDKKSDKKEEKKD